MFHWFFGILPQVASKPFNPLPFDYVIRVDNLINTLHIADVSADNYDGLRLNSAYHLTHFFELLRHIKLYHEIVRRAEGKIEKGGSKQK